MSYETLLAYTGNCLARLRASKRMTKNQVSKKIGVEWKRYDDIEAGKVNITFKTLAKILDILDSNINDLFAQPKTLEPTIEDIKRAGRRLSN